MSTLKALFPIGVFALTWLASAALPAAAEGELLASRALYQVRRAERIERLEVVRTSHRVEHHYLERGVVEVWQRDQRGELEHWKVFPRERRSVHYAPGDLRTVHVAPAWEQLATLIDPAQRAFLRLVRTQRGALGPTRLLEGKVDGQPARIVWNEQHGWAEEITLGPARQRTSFRLLSATPCSDAGCKPLDATETREIEFADLGDAEHDPFVRRFLARFAAHPH